MRPGLLSVITSALLVASVAPASATPKVRRGPTSPRLFKSRSAPAAPRPRVAHIQKIEPQRATQIQDALIRLHYLNGTPSGVWDQETQAAMEKLQSDNGWQTKLVPDARAINKLGLGSGQPRSPAVAATPVDDTESSTVPESPNGTVADR